MIPKEKIAPKYMKDGVPTSTNITGMYRLCEEVGCETYINCPYMRCLKHWYGMVNPDYTNIKEWKDVK